MNALPNVPPIRRHVLLVEDEGILRGLLRDALIGAGYDVLACATVAEALREFPSFDPDALITDIDLGPGGNGIDLAVALARREPSLAIIVLSMYGLGPEYRHPALTRARYLNKMNMEESDVLLKMLEAVLRDEPDAMIDPRATSMPAAAIQVSKLTRKQLHVLGMIAAGLTNAEIAERCGIAVVSVEHMIRRMSQTLELPSDASMNRRVALARLYFDGLGKPDPNRRSRSARQAERRPREARRDGTDQATAHEAPPRQRASGDA